MQGAYAQGPHFSCSFYFFRQHTARDQEDASDVKPGELPTEAFPVSSGQHGRQGGVFLP